MKKIGIIANIKKQQVISIIKTILCYTKSLHFEIYFDAFLKPLLKGEYNFLPTETLVKKIDFLITIGGDGTLLMAARLLKGRNVPILGINTGELGFLNEFLPEEIPQILTHLIKGKYKIESRIMLKTKVSRKNKVIASFLVLNDIVINKEALARIIKFNLYIPCKKSKSPEQISVFAGDGLIISTPTGSTAHSLSAGGPIIHPSLKTFILTPICAHTLTIRPLVVASHQEVWVKIVSEHQEIYLTIDGQKGFKIQPDDLIKVKVAKEKVKLIVSPTRNFYQILRKKLKWGE